MPFDVAHTQERVVDIYVLLYAAFFYRELFAATSIQTLRRDNYITINFAVKKLWAKLLLQLF